MNQDAATLSAATTALKARHVYAMACVCLGIGLAIGYFMRSSQLAVKNANPPALAASPGGRTLPRPDPHRRPSLEDMRLAADKKAAPLLEKLKSTPNDPGLLVQVGAIYHTSHQFKEAAEYYSRALDIDPKNVPIRTKLASSLYRDGDIDGAIAQLNRALTYEPNDANALFDLGMIELQGRSDSKGAVAAWQQLLKTNPQLSADRKATVLKLMADVMQMMDDQHGIKKMAVH